MPPSAFDIKFFGLVFRLPRQPMPSECQTGLPRHFARTTRCSEALDGVTCCCAKPCVCGRSSASGFGLLSLQDGHYVYELGENLTSRCKSRGLLGLGKPHWVSALFAAQAAPALLATSLSLCVLVVRPAMQTRFSARWAKVSPLGTPQTRV